MNQSVNDMFFVYYLQMEEKNQGIEKVSITFVFQEIKINAVHYENYKTIGRK